MDCRLALPPRHPSRGRGAGGPNASPPRSASRPNEDAMAFLDDAYILAPPSRVHDLYRRFACLPAGCQDSRVEQHRSPAARHPFVPSTLASWLWEYRRSFSRSSSKPSSPSKASSSTESPHWPTLRWPGWCPIRTPALAPKHTRAYAAVMTRLSWLAWMPGSMPLRRRPGPACIATWRTWFEKRGRSSSHTVTGGFRSPTACSFFESGRPSRPWKPLASNPILGLRRSEPCPLHSEGDAALDFTRLAATCFACSN